jgi:hypothetical protein
MPQVDLLQAKLGSGIQLKKYMLSYGDKPNDLENACKCMFAYMLSGKVVY